MARSPKSRHRRQEAARGGRKRPAKSAAKARPAERPLAFEPVPEGEPEEDDETPEAAVEAQEPTAGNEMVARLGRRRPADSGDPAERRYLVRELFD